MRIKKFDYIIWLLLVAFGFCAYKTSNILCYIIVFCLILLYMVKLILVLLIAWGNIKNTKDSAIEKTNPPFISQPKNTIMNETENQNTEARITALENEVKRLTMLVDRIYDYTHLGIHKPSLDNPEVLSGAEPIMADDQFQQLIKEGNKIAAAKRYVDLTGVGLLDAKAVVNKLMER